MCILHKNGKAKGLKVSQLVAMAFLNHEPCGQDIVVDHKDNDPSNNRLENLKLITNRENCSKDKKGSSQYAGVSWNKAAKKWHSKIWINGKRIYLGSFKDELEAHKAYRQKMQTI